MEERREQQQIENKNKHKHRIFREPNKTQNHTREQHKTATASTNGQTIRTKSQNQITKQKMGTKTTTHTQQHYLKTRPSYSDKRHIIYTRENTRNNTTTAKILSNTLKTKENTKQYTHTTNETNTLTNNQSAISKARQQKQARNINKNNTFKHRMFRTPNNAIQYTQTTTQQTHQQTIKLLGQKHKTKSRNKTRNKQNNITLNTNKNINVLEINTAHANNNNARINKQPNYPDKNTKQKHETKHTEQNNKHIHADTNILK